MEHAKRTAAPAGDMTQGSPMGHIFLFALPLFVGNLFQQLYSAVDTMIAGYNLGDGAVAAIGATASLSSLLINLASGLNNGYGIVMAQSYGAKDAARLRRVVWSMAVLNLTVTLAVTALSLAFLRPLMGLMQVPADLFPSAYAYISVILVGMAATVGYNMFAGIMRAMGNSRAPLGFLIVSCLLNLVTDILFVVVFAWGVRGAALATVLAQAVSALLAGGYVLRRYREIIPGREDLRPDWALIREMLGVGGSMAAMYCVVDLGSVVYQRSINALGAGMGAYIITAHTAARRIIGIFMMPLSSIATAYSTFVGQNWGAGRPDRLRQTLKQVLGMEVGWGVFSWGVVFAFGAALVRLLTNTADSAVLENAVLSLRCHLACYPALGILFVLRNALQSVGKKAVPVLSSAVELAVKLLAGLWLIPRLGYIVVCLTEPVIWALCALFLGGYFLLTKPFGQAEPGPTTGRPCGQCA